MDLLEAIILGIVQGATEFLPVSSSGHLVLVSWWLNIGTPPLVYSVMVHLGTTAAVLVYFWPEWRQLAYAGYVAVRRREIDVESNPYLRLLILLIVGTIPAGIAGLVLADFFEETFSKPAIVSISLLITAGLLTYSEWVSGRTTPGSLNAPTDLDAQSETDLITRRLGFGDSLFIGVAQALAIMPGISRSGSTIAGGLFRGLSRPIATRYSFLLATPIILAAGLKQTLDVLTGAADVDDDMGLVLLAGFFSAAVVGYLSIAIMLQFVRRQKLYGFAVYCAVFGLLSLGAVLIQG
ncbi:MAG: undecaprenyl-diphosphate phosphatase [Chloroflexi bacterium]|nr:undecaprenyl-diphosphate phosphatase [Chloroflexota bacterium]